MSHPPTFDEAVTGLKILYRRTQGGDQKVGDLKEILDAREVVLSTYQQVFNSANIDAITEQEFRAFLVFKNNRHWVSLQRLGPAICEDMDRLRRALRILLDEDRPIQERLNELVPGRGANYVPGLGKAILTPVLMICHPEEYAVWNRISEGAMKFLGLWPEFERGLPFGDRYAQVNQICLEVARAVEVDLWTLDALWWRAERVATDDDDEEGRPDDISVVEPDEAVRFGIERHLHEFLRDNWDKLDLGREWALYEEDGDPDAGYEYPCAIGRIDLLARHRKDARWLVVELKRNQSSDQTLAQVLRYMGWVKQEMAAPNEPVEGLVIAHKAEDKIRYALTMVQGVGLQLYEVEFHLKSPPRLQKAE